MHDSNESKHDATLSLRSQQQQQQDGTFSESLETDDMLPSGDHCYENALQESHAENSPGSFQSRWRHHGNQNPHHQFHRTNEISPGPQFTSLPPSQTAPEPKQIPHSTKTHLTAVVTHLFSRKGLVIVTLALSCILVALLLLLFVYNMESLLRFSDVTLTHSAGNMDYYSDEKRVEYYSLHELESEARETPGQLELDRRETPATDSKHTSHTEGEYHGNDAHSGTFLRLLQSITDTFQLQKYSPHTAPYHLYNTLQESSNNSSTNSTDTSPGQNVEPTKNYYKIHPFKSFLLLFFPDAFVAFNQNVLAPIFQGTLLELFYAAIPRMALYDFEKNVIDVRFVSRAYPEEIIVSANGSTVVNSSTSYTDSGFTTVSANGTSTSLTLDELKFAHINDYVSYWQGIFSVGFFVAFVGMAICMVLFLSVFFSVVYACLWHYCGSTLTRDTILFKTDPRQWLSSRRVALRVRLCSRFYLCCHSILLILALIIWSFFALQSVPASSLALAQYHSKSQEMNDNTNHFLQNSVNDVRNATSYINVRLNDVNSSLISVLPNNTIIDTYKSCPITLVNSLPSTSVLKDFVGNVSGTLNSLPDLSSIQASADRINSLVARALVQLDELSSRINDLLSVLLSLLPYFSTLQEELDQYALETEPFPSVADLNSIIEGLSTFEDIFLYNFTSSFISTFEATLNSNTFPSTGLYKAAVVIDEFNDILHAVLDARVELLITSARKLKSTKASLHPDAVLRSTSDVLQVELQKANFTSLLTVIEEIDQTFDELANQMSQLEDYVNTVNITLNSLPSFSIMTAEIDKITAALNKTTCMNVIIDHMQYINQTQLQLPSSMDALLNLYATVKDLILEIDMPGKIQSVLTPIIFASDQYIPPVYTELEKFDFKGLRESFPSVNEISSEADELSHNYTESLLSFNMDNFQQQLSSFNSSISLIPDLSTFADSFATINSTLYDALVVNSNGMTGPPISLETIADVFFEEQPTLANNTGCDVDCEDRVRNSEISGGTGTGPTKPMVMLVFWVAACVPSIEPHVWCWFKDAVANRPNTTELIEQMKIAKDALSNIPDWNILTSKTQALNNSISGLNQLQYTLVELSNSTAELSVRNPNFTIFKNSINSFQYTLNNVNFSVVNEAVDQAVSAYSIISDNTPLDIFSDVSNIISTQLNYSSYVDIYNEVGNHLQQRVNEMQSLDNAYQERASNFFESFDVYDIVRILVFLFFCISLILSPCCCNVCCVALCGMRKEYNKWICARPCNLLCIALFFTFCGAFSWIVVFLGLPLNILLRDTCPNMEDTIWTTASTFLPLTEHSNSLRNISASDLQINELITGTNVSTSVRANFSFSLRDIFFAYTRDACTIDVTSQMLQSLDAVTGNMSLVIDDYVYALPLPQEVNVLSDMIATSVPIQQDIHTAMQDALSSIADRFQCDTVYPLYQSMKTSVCDDFFSSLSFFWGMFIIVGIITTVGAAGFIVSYCLMVNTQIREDYSQLLEEHEERFTDIVDALEEYNLQRVLPENLTRLFKKQEKESAFIPLEERKKFTKKKRQRAILQKMEEHLEEDLVRGDAPSAGGELQQNTLVGPGEAPEAEEEDSMIPDSESFQSHDD